MSKVKSTAVKEVEAGIQSIFDAKEKASVRNAFDKFIPFGAKSTALRKSLAELEDKNMFPGDERATRCIVELSNVIQPFLYHLNDEQYEQLNEQFAKTLSHIVRLENSIVNHPPPPKVEPAPPPPLELEVILSNNDVLRKHIETIESQITFVKESKRKLIESNQTHVSQLEKQNAQLRVNLQKAQVECEQYHQQYLQKEKELQTALVQLSGAQEELKRVKFEYDENSLNSKKDAMESFQRNSKYSAKEFVKLNAIIDAMRLELTKERLDRSHERETLKSTLISTENKLNYSEVVINELRDQLQNIGQSQYQETSEFKNSVLHSTIHSFQPQNLDIDYLHASTGTTANLNVTQNSSTRPEFKHPYTPSVLRHGISKNPLVQSPVHTLPRGANYVLMDNNSPLKSYRYKSPFVVKNVDNSVAGTPPVYAGQSAKKRSQSASALRSVAYAPIATVPTGRGRNSSSRETTPRSSSVGRGGIRSLRGVSIEALKSLSSEQPVSTHSLPHHLVSTSTSIPADQLLSSGGSIADKIGLAAWNHPMYRSLQAKGFAPIRTASASGAVGDDADSIPVTEDGQSNALGAVNAPGSISRILATTHDQHSLDESEASSVERVEYISDDMLDNNGQHQKESDEQAVQELEIDERAAEHQEQHHPHHLNPAVLHSEHEVLKNMPLTPQRLSHSNSFTAGDNGTGSADKSGASHHSPLSIEKRAASLSKIDSSSSATALDLSKYRNAASSPIEVPASDVAPSVAARDQASSPFPISDKASRHISTSPLPSTAAENAPELSRMTPSPQRLLSHGHSFSHAATSPTGLHSPLTHDKRSASLSRVNAQQFDPTIFQQHAATSPMHPAVAAVETHEQGTATSPMQQYAEDLRNMSESPGKLSRSISFRDQQSETNLKSQLSSDKRSASMNHKPNGTFDPSQYQQQLLVDTATATSPVAPDYSEHLKNMTESPSGLSRSASFNARSGYQGAPLDQNKRSASLTKVAGVTRIDSGIRAAAAKKPPTPSGLSTAMSMATFSIQEVEEEGESSAEEAGGEGDGDDLSTITPQAAVDDNTPTPNLMLPAGHAASASVGAAGKEHDEQLLKSLYDEIQHLKLTHLSPPRVTGSRSPKVSPFTGEHSHHHETDGHHDHDADITLTSIHAENLHAIQAELPHNAAALNRHHEHVHSVKYDTLIREYNELLSLYIHEMKKTRRMQIDFRNEIHDSTRSVSEFEEMLALLKNEKHQLQLEVDNLQALVVQNATQHNQHIVDVEHKYAALEKELLATEDTLRNKERELRTLHLTNQAAVAAAPAPVSRNPATNHVESCLVQLKIHSNDREISKIVELLKKELNALYATESGSRSPLATGGAVRQVSSLPVSDMQVDITMEALKNLLHWHDEAVAAKADEVNAKMRTISDLRERISGQNSLLENKEQLLQDARMRLADLERQRSTPPPALSAAENQILSLKNQLEHTYQELEEAKKRHHSSNGTANLTITSSGLPPPRGTQSPLRSGGTSSSAARRLQQEHEALSSAYSGRHSPTRARQNQQKQQQQRSGGIDSGFSSAEDGFISSPEPDEDRYHHDLQYIAQPSTNSSRFRESLMNDNAGASAGAGIEPFSPQAGHQSHADASHLLRRSHDSHVNQSLQAQNSKVLKEMEKRALAAEMKCELLANQIKNMPASLSVANAEKRVMECKLKKATLNFEVALKQMEADSLHKIGEFKTFLQLERTEKEALQSKIKDQAATIHQLTHHLKLIHASKAPPEVSANSASFLYQEGTIKVQVPPAPWENGVGSPAGSVMSAYSGAVDPTGVSVNTSHHQQSRMKDFHFYNTVDYSSRGRSPQRGR